jgi:hypothetical protein
VATGRHRNPYRSCRTHVHLRLQLCIKVSIIETTMEKLSTHCLQSGAAELDELVCRCISVSSGSSASPVASCSEGVA